jgi:hypothetical protein
MADRAEWKDCGSCTEEFGYKTDLSSVFDRERVNIVMPLATQRGGAERAPRTYLRYMPAVQRSHTIVTYLEDGPMVEETRALGFTGEIRWDTTKPDDQPSRTLATDSAPRVFLFTATTSMAQGLHPTINWIEPSEHV